MVEHTEYTKHFFCIWQVLAEAEQIRKEADNVGPRAELDFWKRRMTKFNHLLDQIKMPQVKAVLGIISAAKSRTLRVRPLLLSFD